MIVVADSQPVTSLSVGLRFKNLALSKRIHDDLDRAWFAWLIEASEECSSIVQHVKLIQVDALLIPASLVAVHDHANRLVLTRHEDHRLLCIIRLVNLDARLVDIGHQVLPDWIGIALLRIEKHHLHCGVEG